MTDGPDEAAYVPWHGSGWRRDAAGEWVEVGVDAPEGPDAHDGRRQGRDDGTQGLTAHEKVPLLRAKIERLERERDDLQRQVNDVRELIKPQWRRTYSEDYSQGRNDMIDAIRAVLPPEENDTT